MGRGRDQPPVSGTTTPHLAATPLGRLRVLTLAFVLIWVPSYWSVWGWRNFLQLCDVAVFLTALGLWQRSPVLLSSQAVGSLVINVLWGIDVAARLLAGRHLVGGTEYMWNSAFPLWVRAMSLFHLVLPILHLWALRQIGYDRRGFRLEALIVAAVFVAARSLAAPGTNPNFVFSAPVFQRAFGPPAVHLALLWATQVVVLMLPVHLMLRHWLPPPAAKANPNPPPSG
jgi:hypothetical protein